MRVFKNWKDYELIDCSAGERLERWKEYILIRPDPQVIWNTPRGREWERADARYLRSSAGGGKWEYGAKLPDTWKISLDTLTFNIKPTGFKHTGLFPEQAANWEYVSQAIKKSGTQPKMLNLFAYTGGATVSALAAGAAVTHVDAAKGMVAWAKENADLSGVADRPVRWLVDDCVKFAEREIRRGNRYDIIIMDPPSYGKGPGGEIWQLENEVYRLAELCTRLLSDDPLLFMINSYTTGLSPSSMEYVLGATAGKKFGGRTFSDEIGLPVTKTGMALPCGSTAVWRNDHV